MSSGHLGSVSPLTVDFSGSFAVAIIEVNYRRIFEARLMRANQLAIPPHRGNISSMDFAASYLFLNFSIEKYFVATRGIKPCPSRVATRRNLPS